MRNTFLTILIIFSATAYAQDKNIIKGVKKYNVYTNKDVAFKEDPLHNVYAEIVDGNNLAFEYMMRADKHLNMTDDEYMERILFSVPKNAKSFFYTDTTLKAALLIGCFCPNRGWFTFSDGFIKGKKINATTWKVEMDVMTKPNPEKRANAMTRKIKANFVMVKPSVTNTKK